LTIIRPLATQKLGRSLTKNLALGHLKVKNYSTTRKLEERLDPENQRKKISLV